MMREVRASALRGKQDATFGLHVDTKYSARRIRGDLGHDGYSWPRGAHNHRANAPRCGTRLARSAALGESDIRLRHNFARPRRAYPGGRAMGVRVQSRWRPHRFRGGLVLLGRELYDRGFRPSPIAASVEAAGTIRSRRWTADVRSLDCADRLGYPRPDSRPARSLRAQIGSSRLRFAHALRYRDSPTGLEWFSEDCQTVFRT